MSDDDMQYHFLPLQLGTPISDDKFIDKQNTKILRIPTSMFKAKCSNEYKNHINSFPSTQIINVQEFWFHGIRMFSPLEIVYYRFKSEDKKFVFGWFGCNLPRGNGFDVVIAECLKNILNSGCTEEDAEDWVQNLDALKKWICHSQELMDELYKYRKYTPSIKM